MAQTRKKTATKTAKKGARKAPACRKCATKTAKRRDDGQERMHVYIITAMSMIAGILLCANAAMMMV